MVAREVRRIVSLSNQIFSSGTPAPTNRSIAFFSTPNHGADEPFRGGE